MEQFATPPPVRLYNSPEKKYDDIELCMIDLHEVQRSLCAVEHPGPRRKLIDRGLAMRPATQAFPRWNRRDPNPNRVCVRRTSNDVDRTVRCCRVRKCSLIVCLTISSTPASRRLLPRPPLGLYGSSDESSPDARYARAHR
jgi:hypothetical protein